MGLHIVLIRHATAEDKGLSGDSERALTSQGREESKISADVFKQFEVPKPTFIFTSGYKRAEQTLSAYSVGKDAKVVVDKNFYPDGDAVAAAQTLKKSLIELRSRSDKERACVWMVGHNPSIERILNLLSPRAFSSLMELQKCSAVWLEWESDVKNLAEEPRLRALFPKPRP